MAMVATLQQATKHSVEYLVTGDDSDTLNLDAASGVTPDLATDTVNGPEIHKLLTTACAAQANARTLIYGSKCRVTVFNEGTGVLQVVPNANAGKLRLELTAVDTVRSLLRLEFVHSLGR